MHVVATAGHVDHGKSTLVKALTGTDPDRLEEEKRRGLSLDLGFAWCDLPGLEDTVAFVDVPGHARFVSTMLAGVGPVPVVLLVVAADGGWMPQSSEHLDALAALHVRHGLLVLTRADLADRARTDLSRAQARSHLAGTPLAGIGEVVVSAATGQGMEALRAALAGVLAGVPPASPAAPVRLWIDRSFSIRGAGTVVTGTLPAGHLAVGDELALGARAGRVVVRGLQTQERGVDAVDGLARVAVNLRGVGPGELHRGNVLTTPGSYRETSEVDVAVRRTGPTRTGPTRTGPTRTGPTHGGDPRRAETWGLPEQLVLHLGSAAVPVRSRALGPSAARLRLAVPLALRIGDVGLLRDPGEHRILAGIDVLDPAPPPLTRRGAAVERARVLSGMDAVPDAAGELARRRVVSGGELLTLGVGEQDVAALRAAPGVVTADDWFTSAAHADRLRTELTELVRAAARERPLERGVPLEAARAALKLPTVGLVAALVGGASGPVAQRPRTPLVVAAGTVVPAGTEGGSGPSLPLAVADAVASVLAEMSAAPYCAPEAGRLRELGLGARELGAAVRVGALSRVGEGVYLSPAAVAAAAGELAALRGRPFTSGEARVAWGTTRRVAIPLLELLDRRGLTRRLPDARRELTGACGPPDG